ncbi:PETER PAN-like protein, partial [Striga asiatica]
MVVRWPEAGASISRTGEGHPGKVGWDPLATLLGHLQSPAVSCLQILRARTQKEIHRTFRKSISRLGSPMTRYQFSRRCPHDLGNPIIQEHGKEQSRRALPKSINIAK